MFPGTAQWVSGSKWAGHASESIVSAARPCMRCHKLLQLPRQLHQLPHQLPQITLHISNCIRGKSSSTPSKWNCLKIHLNMKSIQRHKVYDCWSWLYVQLLQVTLQTSICIRCQANSITRHWNCLTSHFNRSFTTDETDSSNVLKSHFKLPTASASKPKPSPGTENAYQVT